jgi:carbon storage regulator
MLVLQRRAGESVIIDGDIVVKILSVVKGTVRLGIEAPQDVSIHREEVQERIDQEQTPEDAP